ncbi:NADPH-dependent FMN reductase [Bacteriovorax sp. Seq25_V]|uniref:NADPH-dependent FMN reductase n=1 Tax=Bacteriovorax sp. Seq25_V TaxID=1201288 RepID=UPI000389E541|nr:NAD(P)H-dependent oxidoreductase [Bacteriovorax sp. Seq25_V]EQC47977.1 flavin reductase [Bacteriovorax sp. Seq25_V]
MTKKITIVVASDGKNLDLANQITKDAKVDNVEFNIIRLSQYSLPLYTNDEEQANGIPQAAKDLYSELKPSHGYIFIAPEYNGSVPPIFINSIAWVSRSGNEDWREVFNEKPAIIATHSGGGGIHVLEAMQSQLSFIGVNVIARKLHTTYSKPLNLDSLDAAMRQLVQYASLG